MRVLLTGASGFLGTWLRAHVAADWVCLSRNGQPTFFQTPSATQQWHACDLTSADSVKTLADQIDVDAVVHLAGNKDIEWCQAHPDDARRINRDATCRLLETFPVPMLFFSSDYVFDGTRGDYRETDTPDPQTTYGATKHEAESAGLQLAPERFHVLRAGAIYAAGAGFLKYLSSMLAAGKTPECYKNAIYSPTDAHDIGTFIQKWLESPAQRAPVSHLAGDALTRYDFALIFADIYGYEKDHVKPVQAQGRFFPNLSLNDEATRARLSMPRLSHAQSLQRLRDADAAHA